MPTVKKSRIALLIVLASIAGSALFLAQGSTELVASWVLPSDAGAGERGGRRGDALPTSAARRTKDPMPILARNIFDHVTGALDGSRVEEPTEPTGPTEPPPPADPNAPPPPCDGAIRLVASVVNARDADRSFAAITDATGKAMLYRRGMPVGERTVVDILAARVHLAPAGGGLCSISMFAPPTGTTVAQALGPSAIVSDRPPEITTVEAPGAGGLATAELDSGIQQISDTNFNVQRSLVNRLLENQAELMRTARIIPHEEGGRVVGVKLYGIRRNSLLGRLGLQNGDMLRTINGFDMSSPDSALEAYARLREQAHLTVAVDRRGQPMNIDYNIQ